MNGKLRSRKGFTLTELLTAVAILGLLTAAVAAGVPVAMRVYRQSVAVSEAQTLCATLTTAIADELRYATDISGSGAEDSSVTFNSTTYGVGVTVNDGSDGKGKIRIGNIDLLSDKAYPSGLTASSTVSYDDSKNVLTLCVTVKSGENELASSKVSISPLNG